MMEFEKIKAADAMQQYIQEHLREPITMKELADCTAYSPWHAARIFKEAMGLSPFTYIRKLRLSHAAVALWDEEERILDIALDFVFASHDGFTRAFTKEFGLTPYAYKKQTPVVQLFKPDSIRDHYRYLQGNDPLEAAVLSPTFFVQLVHFPKRRLIYYPCTKEADDYFAYASNVGCDVWGMLCSIKEALYEPVGVWFPEKLRPQGCSTYVQGVEVPLSYGKELPKPLQILTLPACDMLVFQGAPFEDAQYGEAITYLTKEIEQYQPELYGYCWDTEAAPKIQLEPEGYRGYIEARCVKEILRPKKKTIRKSSYERVGKEKA